MTVALWILLIWAVASVLFVTVGVWWANRPARQSRPGFLVGGPETRLREDDR